MEQLYSSRDDRMMALVGLYVCVAEPDIELVLLAGFITACLPVKIYFNHSVMHTHN